MLLAGDIGGTKTVLALFDIRDGKPFPVVDRTYPSQGISSLAATVLRFLEETAHTQDRQDIGAACFAVAAPVYGPAYTFTNLALTIHPDQVRKQLSFIPRLAFINDLEALGHWILSTEEQDCFCLYAGRPVDGGRVSLNKAVLAPGTGLGEALILAGKDVYPTEGGHADFAPQAEIDIDLLRFLQKDYDHVSYERLLSGPGLVNIYRFLGSRRGEPLPEPLPSPEEISRRGLTGACPTCQEALEIFTRILGAEAGNLALRALALGGIYLGGGIPPKILPKLREGVFLQSFLQKGRFTTLVEKVPVYVILEEQAPLQGAAWVAWQKITGS
ncbi:MAG TPA: glucokinase [Clostridia bacterium]|nr:glucokinase [Clostridia bacterium]